jgi:hypothetical protein
MSRFERSLRPPAVSDVAAEPLPAEVEESDRGQDVPKPTCSVNVAHQMSQTAAPIRSQKTNWRTLTSPIGSSGQNRQLAHAASANWVIEEKVARGPPNRSPGRFPLRGIFVSAPLWGCLPMTRLTRGSEPLWYGRKQSGPFGCVTRYFNENHS